MKHFTPHLFVRLQECDDPAAFRAANQAWEQAVEAYGQQLTQITPSLSRGLRRLVGFGSLHDAHVQEIGAGQRQVTIVLREESSAGRLVSLVYSLVDAPVIDLAAIPEQHRTPRATWLYDEIDVEPDAGYHPRLGVQARAPMPTDGRGWGLIFSHSILLSNGWELRLRFHRLRASRSVRLLRHAEAAQ